MVEIWLGFFAFRVTVALPGRGQFRPDLTVAAISEKIMKISEVDFQAQQYLLCPHIRYGEYSWQEKVNDLAHYDEIGCFYVT